MTAILQQGRKAIGQKIFTNIGTKAIINQGTKAITTVIPKTKK